MIDFKNPVWADKAHTAIDVIMKHPAYGWIPYTCTAEMDTEEGRELWEQLQSDTASIAEYVPPVIPDDVLAAEARSKRDKLLADTDYLLMTDYPISADKLAEVKTYRQALRDIPKQAGFPRTITWPDKP